MRPASSMAGHGNRHLAHYDFAGDDPSTWVVAKPSYQQPALDNWTYEPGSRSTSHRSGWAPTAPSSHRSPIRPGSAPRPVHRVKPASQGLQSVDHSFGVDGNVGTLQNVIDSLRAVVVEDDLRRASSGRSGMLLQVTQQLQALEAREANSEAACAMLYGELADARSALADASSKPTWLPTGPHGENRLKKIQQLQDDKIKLQEDKNKLNQTVGLLRQRLANLGAQNLADIAEKEDLANNSACTEELNRKLQEETQLLRQRVAVMGTQNDADIAQNAKLVKSLASSEELCQKFREKEKDHLAEMAEMKGAHKQHLQAESSVVGSLEKHLTNAKIAEAAEAAQRTELRDEALMHWATAAEAKQAEAKAREEYEVQLQAVSARHKKEYEEQLQAVSERHKKDMQMEAEICALVRNNLSISEQRVKDVQAESEMRALLLKTEKHENEMQSEASICSLLRKNLSDSEQHAKDMQSEAEMCELLRKNLSEEETKAEEAIKTNELSVKGAEAFAEGVINSIALRNQLAECESGMTGKGTDEESKASEANEESKASEADESKASEANEESKASEANEESKAET